MISPISLSHSDFYQLMEKKDNYYPEMSLIDSFIDVFIRLVGGETKREWLIKLHENLYGNHKTSKEVLGAVKILIENIEHSYRDGFHAEIVFNGNCLLDGNVGLLVYHDKKLLKKIDSIPFSEVIDQQIDEKIATYPIVTEDMISQWMKCSKSALTELEKIKNRINSEPAWNAKKTLISWYESELSQFLSGMKISLFGNSYFHSREEQIDISCQSLRNEILESEDGFLPLVIEIKSLIEGFLYGSYMYSLNKINQNMARFSQGNMASDISHRLKYIDCFYKNLGELLIMTGQQQDMVFDLLDNAINAMKKYYHSGFDSYFGCRPNEVENMPSTYVETVSKIEDMLLCYHELQPRENPIFISMESVNDYDHRIGFLNGYLVKLLQGSKVVKKMTIPAGFCFLIKNYILDKKQYIETGNSTVDIPTCNVFSIKETATHNAFILGVGEYFGAHETPS